MSDRLAHDPEMAAFAEALKRQFSGKEPSPYEVHWTDQQTAAARETHDVMDNFAGTGGLLNGFEATALVMTACARRSVRYCDHFFEARQHSDLSMLSLTTRWGRCEPCWQTYEHNPDDDDSGCDLCNEPVHNLAFMPFLLPFGSVIVQGYAGPCCWPIIDPEGKHQ